MYLDNSLVFDGTIMSAVKRGGELSSWFSVLSGTDQIEIHGPLPFKIVINWAAQLAECNKTVSKAGGSLFTALRVENGSWISTMITWHGCNG